MMCWIVLDRVGGGAESFVVGGPLGQERKPRSKMGVGVADESSFGGVAEQGLDHGEGDQFGVGERRCDADGRAFGLPVRMILQQVIDRDVQSCRESVQVSVHAVSSKIRRGFNADHGRSRTFSGGSSRGPRAPLGANHLDISTSRDMRREPSSPSIIKAPLEGAHNFAQNDDTRLAEDSPRSATRPVIGRLAIGGFSRSHWCRRCRSE